MPKSNTPPRSRPPSPLLPLTLAIASILAHSPSHAQPTFKYKAYVKDLLSTGSVIPPPPPEALGELTITPSSFNFGMTSVGSSAQAVFTVKNTSSNPLSLITLGQPALSLTTGSGFQLLPSCPQILTFGASCEVIVQYTPPAMATAAASFSFPSANAATPLPLASLSGQGALATLQLSTTTLAFPNTDVLTTSPPQTITLTNTGNQPQPLTSFTATSPFAISSNSCPSSLAPSASCTVSLTFSPELAQTYNKTLDINSAGTSYSAALSGTGLGPLILAVPSALDSSDSQDTDPATSVAPSSVTPLGLTPITNPPSLPYKKTERTITLTNSGTRTLHNLTISGQVASNSSNSAAVPFVTNNCSTSLPAGASCSITVTAFRHIPFRASGSISITGDGLAPVSIPLSMSVVSPTTNPETLNKLTSDSLSFNFGSLTVGQPSAKKTVTLTYNGTSSASVRIPTTHPLITTSNDNCSNTTLTPGDSCSVDLALTPLAPFQQSTTWTPSFAFGSATTFSPLQHNFGFIGLGEQLNLSPINFGTNPPNTLVSTSTSISNTGNRPTSLSLSPSLSSWNAAFSLSACPSALQPGTACTLSATTTTPSVDGPYSGSLTLSGSTSSTTKNVSLTVSNAPALSLSAASVDFGLVSRNSTTPSFTIVATNTGGSTANIGALATTSPFDVTVSPAPGPAGTGCSLSAIEPLSSCHLTFTILTNALPSNTSNFSDTITLAPNTPYSKSISLSAKTLPSSANSLSNITLNPPALTFPFIPTSQQSLPQSITLTNHNDFNFAVNVDLVGAYRSSYTITSNTCPATLLANASCTISAQYAPNGSEAGDAPAAIQITDPVSAASLAVKLSSNSAPVNALDFSPLDLNPSNPQSDKTVKQVFYKNNSSQTQQLTPSLSNSLGFNILSHTCSSVAPNAYCTATIHALSDTQGMFQNSLDINGTTYNLSSSVYAFPKLQFTSNSNPISVLDLGVVSHKKPLPSSILQLINSSPTQADINPITFMSLSGVSQANNCPPSIVQGSPCDFQINITPTTQNTPIDVNSYKWGSTLSVSTKDGIGSVSLPIRGTSLVGTWQLSPSINFGNVYIGQSVTTQSTSITNTSQNGAEIKPYRIESNKATLTLDPSQCTSTWLATGQTCSTPLTFTPTSTSDTSGTITYYAHGKSGQPTSIPWTATILSGFSTEGVVSPSSWEPTTTVGTPTSQLFTITNTYYQPVTVTGPLSALPAKITMASNSCNNQTLQPNASCSFTLSFNSTSAYEDLTQKTVTFKLSNVNQNVSASIPAQHAGNGNPSISSITHGSDPTGYGLLSTATTAAAINGSGFSTSLADTQVFVNNVQLSSTASTDPNLSGWKIGTSQTNSKINLFYPSTAPTGTYSVRVHNVGSTADASSTLTLASSPGTLSQTYDLQSPPGQPLSGSFPGYPTAKITAPASTTLATSSQSSSLHALTLENTGGMPLTIAAPSFTGKFTPSSDSCTGTTSLAPGASCTITGSLASQVGTSTGTTFFTVAGKSYNYTSSNTALTITNSLAPQGSSLGTVSWNSVNIGATPVGIARRIKSTITLNNGPKSYVLASISGTNKELFTIDTAATTCDTSPFQSPAGVAAGTSCDVFIDVNTNTASSTPITATLNINTSPGVTAKVDLSALPAEQGTAGIPLSALALYAPLRNTATTATVVADNSVITSHTPGNGWYAYNVADSGEISGLIQIPHSSRTPFQVPLSTPYSTLAISNYYTYQNIRSVAGLYAAPASSNNNFISGTNAFTIAAWVSPTYAGAPYPSIFLRGPIYNQIYNISSTEYGMNFHINAAGNVCLSTNKGNIWNQPSTGTSTACSSASVNNTTINAWSHIAASRSCDSSSCYITFTVNGTSETPVPAPLVSISANSQAAIGFYPSGISGYEPTWTGSDIDYFTDITRTQGYKGMITDLFVSNRIITPQELKNAYDSKAPILNP